MDNDEDVTDIRIEALQRHINDKDTSIMNATKQIKNLFKFRTPKCPKSSCKKGKTGKTSYQC